MVRFIDMAATVNTEVIKERLLGVVSADKTIGEAPAELLLTVIKRAGLKIDD